MRFAGRLLVVIPCLVLTLTTIGAPNFAALERAASGLFHASSSVHEAAAIHSEPSRTPAEQDPVAGRFLTTRSSAEPFRPVDDVEHVSVAIVPEGRGALLTTLYGSFIGLQALDVHSTRLAVSRGATERNALMAPLSGNTAAMTGVKAGITAGVIFMTERVRVRNRMAAVMMMAAFNSAYATVVTNNYRVAARAAR